MSSVRSKVRGFASAPSAASFASAPVWVSWMKPRSGVTQPTVGAGDVSSVLEDAGFFVASHADQYGMRPRVPLKGGKNGH